MSLYGPSPVRLALIRSLPHSFEKALQQHAPLVPIDRARADRQHESYSSILREWVPHVLEIPADEAHPDCCFIEDTAIVVDQDVIISRIGADSRRGESKAVHDAFAKLIKQGFDLRLHQLNGPACLDGGDVLQMGGWVFVGLSQRTNAAAIAQLEKILPGRVVTIPVADGLHLKSLLSAVDDRTVIAADTIAAKTMADLILNSLNSRDNARCILVPDAVAANVVRLGSQLLIQAGWPRSQALLQELADELKLNLMPVDMSELCKADGALTCCSILVP